MIWYFKIILLVKFRYSMKFHRFLKCFLHIHSFSDAMISWTWISLFYYCIRCKEKKTKRFFFNIFQEELVLQDDFCYKAPKTIKTKNRKKDVNVPSEKERDTNWEFSKSLRTDLSLGDLQIISNKQILADNVINSLQRMLTKQFIDVHSF